MRPVGLATVVAGQEVLHALIHRAADADVPSIRASQQGRVVVAHRVERDVAVAAPTGADGGEGALGSGARRDIGSLGRGGVLAQRLDARADPVLAVGHAQLQHDLHRVAGDQGAKLGAEPGAARDADGEPERAHVPVTYQHGGRPARQQGVHEQHLGTGSADVEVDQPVRVRGGGGRVAEREPDPLGLVGRGRNELGWRARQGVRRR